MHVAFPYAIDSRGRTAEAATDAHVRDLIEQLLLTAPGERVNRPAFGSGLFDLLFEPAAAGLVAATGQSVQASLQQWLGELIVVERVDVEGRESELAVTVSYVLRRTQERRVATITRERP